VDEGGDVVGDVGCHLAGAQGDTAEEVGGRAGDQTGDTADRHDAALRACARRRDRARRLQVREQ
jgi:hypothetical protein